ncbi:MAG TPA: NUDIX hydrolase [Solirubrobacteraceae bacterium]|nr:NUDIX hydrolase [Solirubrobacteraceae bacterium]
MERVDRPGPGEELNRGAVTPPRLAAAVMLLRDGGDQAGGMEVLLVQRNPKSRFMGGAWVFPGGAVHADDGEGEDGHRAAAVRELAEEASVSVAAGELVAFSRWITPEQVSIRFDTYFFLAPVPNGASPQTDGDECVAHGWFAPEKALAEHRAGELLLVFPTIKQLEQLARFESVAKLLDHARAHTVEPIQPRLLFSGETARVVLPGEPGYDD